MDLPLQTFQFLFFNSNHFQDLGLVSFLMCIRNKGPEGPRETEPAEQAAAPAGRAGSRDVQSKHQLANRAI